MLILSILEIIICFISSSFNIIHYIYILCFLPEIKPHLKGGVFQFIVTLSPIDKVPPVMTEQQTPPLQPGSNAFLSPF